MNKISLISLTLSFLFTICNGLVPSAYSDDTDSKDTENSSAVGVGNSTEGTEQPQSNLDETKKKEDNKTKRSKKKRLKKRSKTFSERYGGVRAQSADNKLTDDLNRLVLSNINSSKEVSSQSN